MEELRAHSENPEVETRIRIVIKNCLERRPDGWTQKIDGPKTVKQIKTDYLDQQEKAKYNT